MIWANILSSVLQLALFLARWMERRQAIAEGKAQAVAELLEEADAIINDSTVYRDSVDSSDDAIMRDEFNRRNDEPASPAGDKQSGNEKGTV
jgi:hypothetical protein